MPFDPETFLTPDVVPVSDMPDEQLVTVAYCHYGTVMEPFLESFHQMYQWDSIHGKHWDSIAKSKGPYIPMARNEIVDVFLDKRFAHWLLFLDIDMIFPPNTIETLLSLADPREVPILGALYLTPMNVRTDDPSQLEYLPTWTYDAGWERAPVRTIDFDEPLMELHTCGMGCTLIHRSVFEAMREAYPDDPWKYFNHDLVHVEGRNPERLGEDLAFCTRARNLGFRVWGTPNVRCGHIKSQVLHPLSYRRDRTADTKLFPTGRT